MIKISFTILKDIRNYFRKVRLRVEWRQLNSHNFTEANTVSNIDNIYVGRNTYGTLNVLDYTDDNHSLVIGAYCSIGPSTTFILAAEHHSDTLTTYPLRSKLHNQGNEALSKGDITVGDDVWIGMNSIICSGVSIGQGAIIAAGTIVTKNVPPYSVIAGVPGKVVKYRFDEKIIKLLLSIDLAEKLDDVDSSNIDDYYKLVDEVLIEKFL
ncbi:CatB-related O-acetyltransferase [Vibrio cyclitrophicus]